jgi:uncharacterized protein YodC (DUF2158 family)
VSAATDRILAAVKATPSHKLGYVLSQALCAFSLSDLLTDLAPFIDGDTVNVGDVATLRSGGPSMTVVAVGPCDGRECVLEKGEVECAWFDVDNRNCAEVFPIAALALAGAS